MNENIQYVFDEKINGYIINMPEYISLNSIKEWKNKINHELNSLQLNQKIILLIDTNKHEFESKECLSVLREFLTSNEKIKSNVSKVAFVQPESYMKPYVKSEIEGYFENKENAYKWLIK